MFGYTSYLRSFSLANETRGWYMKYITQVHTQGRSGSKIEAMDAECQGILTTHRMKEVQACAAM